MTRELSSVERYFLAQNIYQPVYPPEEKMWVIVVKSVPELGRLTALRFLEWVQNHPGGTISLPTGKSPEYFIKYTQHYLQNWTHPHIQKELVEVGIDPSRRPQMETLTFIQIDEFFPIDPHQHNSFCYYVKKFYLDGFGLDTRKALLIDCEKIIGYPVREIWPDGVIDLSLRERPALSLREQRQKDMIARVDEWCKGYEEKIRQLGGIGFFLGGIGPDGHIAFNIRGSSYDSQTRLMYTNYETQAAAAGDLGGIEVARKKAVITIGLSTITFNRNCTAIIIAAGEAKASIVAESIETLPNPQYPAASLQSLPQSAFYLTQGAASKLRRRMRLIIQNSPEPDIRKISHLLIDLSVRCRKPIVSLRKEDVDQDPFGDLLWKYAGDRWEESKRQVVEELIQRIERGLKVYENKTFFHTEPHHDDIMLAYLPFLIRQAMVLSNHHYFATLTSGFTAVRNEHLRSYIHLAEDYLKMFGLNLIGSPQEEIILYRENFFNLCSPEIEKVKGSYFLRTLMTEWQLHTLEEVQQKLDWLKSYLLYVYPGQKDPPDVQCLKGALREREVELLWSMLGIPLNHIQHLRLKFYQGDIFTEEPREDRDVLPVYQSLQRIQPHILTVAFDPEGSGPDTHYKVLQAIAAALRRLRMEGYTYPDKVWGYRNVWYEFHPSEVELIIPVNNADLLLVHHFFMNLFETQRDASFPSYLYDGPFSGLAQKIQHKQYQIMVQCLGQEWFMTHPHPLIRSATGMIFMRELTVDELIGYARELKRSTENL